MFPVRYQSARRRPWDKPYSFIHHLSTSFLLGCHAAWSPRVSHPSPCVSNPSLTWAAASSWHAREIDATFKYPFLRGIKGLIISRLLFLMRSKDVYRLTRGKKAAQCISTNTTAYLHTGYIPDNTLYIVSTNTTTKASRATNPLNRCLETGSSNALNAVFLNIPSNSFNLQHLLTLVICIRCCKMCWAATLSQITVWAVLVTSSPTTALHSVTVHSDQSICC